MEAGRLYEIVFPVDSVKVIVESAHKKIIGESNKGRWLNIQYVGKEI